MSIDLEDVTTKSLFESAAKGYLEDIESAAKRILENEEFIAATRSYPSEQFNHLKNLIGLEFEAKKRDILAAKNESSDLLIATLIISTYDDIKRSENLKKMIPDIGKIQLLELKDTPFDSFYNNFPISYDVMQQSMQLLPAIIFHIIKIMEGRSMIKQNLSAEVENQRHAKKRSQIAKTAVNARHNKKGGSRDKAEQIKAIWATGKYSTREICAEEEYQALGYPSFATARKALRNTPAPEKPLSSTQ